MKIKSLKRILRTYGLICVCLSFSSIVITIGGGYLIFRDTGKFSNIWYAVIISIVLNIIGTSLVNKIIIKAYNEKLREDALDLAEKLKQNKLGDANVITEVIDEIHNK